ncbi:uracil-DNA glycosylase (plasmid) [Pontibacillus sp. ALD_SL1]|uniref:uracil-DNA glycosylase n=1 Tax=Pontibacillus sp. ALD_SL1 TaxID=2777185 RepID=UPI001A977DC0|nr:uracil-DNA glycosylase [Pontibacillus sp. ALD_SL1]QST02413.1 uracil-DNA glycosylase [Pontibacillus sp. ALD_SL1]
MEKQPLFLKNLTIDESWRPFFEQPQIQNMLLTIEESIGDLFTPAPSQVLRFANTDLHTLGCIVYGRDPYPQLVERGEKKGEFVATGRSFEVNGIKSWEELKRNASLRNMIKLLHKSALDEKRSASFKRVKKDIRTGAFNLPSPDKIFDYWESQGVLFLNRSFTCEVGKHKGASGKHEKLWTDFFYELLGYIVKKNGGMKHFLWGKARDFAPSLMELGVNQDQIFQSHHPSYPCEEKDGYETNKAFLNNNCFIKTKTRTLWIPNRTDSRDVLP